VVATTGPAPGTGQVQALAVPRQADSDETLIALWLHGRSPRTQRAYRSDITGFLAHVAKPLRAVTLGDLQGYWDTLSGLAPASQARRLSAVKSLMSFGHELGYLPFNVGAPSTSSASSTRTPRCSPPPTWHSPTGRRCSATPR
jgi:site-specific recombinase XerD